nr:tRNA1(Val) (adenine(37)-N6)-methyltransferase [uncultured Moellerella sp.]
MNQSKAQYRKGGFTFKQFFVAHDRCAMKVGTDAVLLGAWAPVEKKQRALDIGCGSGLIALMLAQRNPTLHIDAIELDTDAAAQARENCAESPWSNRLQVYQEDIHHFVERAAHQYDLIVSNPPYFEPAVACRDSLRDQARYTGTLTHQSLLDCAQKRLTPEGVFCLVLPYEVAENVEKQAVEAGWYLHSRVNVRDKATTADHRVLLALSRQACFSHIDALVLKEADGKTYTSAFEGWIRDFYLRY